LEADLNAIFRRLDHDGDLEISFADFFNRLLPYFIYSGLGITPGNQVPPPTGGPRINIHEENQLLRKKIIKKTKSVSSLQSAASRKASMSSHLRGKSSIDMNS